ncbi:uncharacterized protein LOC143251737 [Tachypleus tridentatus]|uniref:uncharacterized protein LOC143251737 n=1 Tax=Tachypleus tridentatus TaxID=6853 RepID=UPI003FD17993
MGDIAQLQDPCPPGHYDNGFQTHCLPCPGGTYMTFFAADACVACPDEEGADNEDLYPTEVVLKVTFPWASKPTVVRYPWWMKELTLISICLIALCVLCCFCNVNEKARGKWNGLKNRVLGSCGVFAYTKIEDQELVTEKITPSELDILEAVSMIPECEKVSTNKFNKRETNMVLKENQTEPTILQTINENHSVEKKTENLSKPASGSEKTKLKKCVRTIVNDDKPEEILKSDSLTTVRIRLKFFYFIVLSIIQHKYITINNKDVLLILNFHFV